MTPQKNTARRLNRVGQILKLFLEKDRVSTATLSQTLQTTTRTIQRDILFLRQAGFPVSETGQGRYQLDKNIFRNLEVFDENELALMVALKNTVSQLGEPFQKAADGIFNRLYQASASLPLFIKIDEAAPLDSRLLNRIVKAIRSRRCVRFQYRNAKPHPAFVEPYKVVYFDGFWYLVAMEQESGIVKRYALDRIYDFKLTPTCAKNPPKNLEAILQSSANIWFSMERDQEVVIEVNPKVASYFKRRKIFPTQEIREEKQDGSLIVVFKVGKFEEIRDTLKAWLPNVKILAPFDFKDNLLSELKNWLRWQSV
jgi:predicted DNA-binding transcriptional regulator YafY